MSAHQYIPKVSKKSQKRDGYHLSADHTPQRVLRQFEKDCSVSPPAARAEGGRCVGQIPLTPPFSKGEAWPERSEGEGSLVEGREEEGDRVARSSRWFRSFIVGASHPVRGLTGAAGGDNPPSRAEPSRAEPSRAEPAISVSARRTHHSALFRRARLTPWAVSIAPGSVMPTRPQAAPAR